MINDEATVCPCCRGRRLASRGADPGVLDAGGGDRVVAVACTLDLDHVWSLSAAPAFELGGDALLRCS